jgi:hypothetical protein
MELQAYFTTLFPVVSRLIAFVGREKEATVSGQGSTAGCLAYGDVFLSLTWRDGPSLQHEKYSYTRNYGHSFSHLASRGWSTMLIGIGLCEEGFVKQSWIVNSPSKGVESSAKNNTDTCAQRTAQI